MSNLIDTYGDKFLRAWHHYFPKYVFIHINKTAGSSIEAALRLRFEHKTAVEKRSQIGERAWIRAFKFSMVRNPWDRLLSMYFYRIKTNQTSLGVNPIDFSDWVTLTLVEKSSKYFDQPDRFKPQIDWLVDDTGQCIVDYVGRFENLHQDFREICSRIGVNAELPHLKSSKSGDYREHYTDDLATLVGEFYQRDIASFGYRF